MHLVCTMMDGFIQKSNSQGAVFVGYLLECGLYDFSMVLVTVREQSIG
jgi:hypothetical protein